MLASSLKAPSAARGSSARPNDAVSSLVCRRCITSGGRLAPNRFTKYFQRLQTTCPDAIQAYADCVNRRAGSTNDESGSDSGSMLLQKGVCQQEFDQVKACWNEIRRAAHSSNGGDS
jgi:hypothetical protein